MTIDAYRYDGKRALVIGGATGMGAATAEAVATLGGEVVVMDVAEITVPCKQSVYLDLTRKESIDEALEALDGPFHAVFACAGVADGTPHLMKINFTGQRYLLERLNERDALPPRSAIVMISSVAGLGWQQDLATIGEFLDAADWDAAHAWIGAHPELDGYAFSKKAINAYVARECFGLLQKGIRINAIEPGPTDTPLARANAEVWLGFAADYNRSASVETLSPSNMADVLVFLCSEAAAGINGVSILVDQGQIGSITTGRFAPPDLMREVNAPAT